jgi:hypothetical protein
MKKLPDTNKPKKPPGKYRAPLFRKPDFKRVIKFAREMNLPVHQIIVKPDGSLSIVLAPGDGEPAMTEETLKALV